MDAITEKLRQHSSATPSRWREDAEYRRRNSAWLQHSMRIAVKMLNRMNELGLSQKLH